MSLDMISCETGCISDPVSLDVLVHESLTSMAREKYDALPFSSPITLLALGSYKEGVQ